MQMEADIMIFFNEDLLKNENGKLIPNSPPTNTNRKREVIFKLACSIHKKAEFERAFEHYKSAADLGHVEARFLVGAAYANGEGVEKNNQQAIKHFKLYEMQVGSDKLYHSAYYYYSKGNNIENFEEAFEYSETPRVKTRGISRYKLRLPYVLHNVSYSPKT